MPVLTRRRWPVDVFSFVKAKPERGHRVYAVGSLSSRGQIVALTQLMSELPAMPSRFSERREQMTMLTTMRLCESLQAQWSRHSSVLYMLRRDYQRDCKA